jgi:nitrogen regulatory protein PII
MKMVVAYVEPERFDQIREDLLELGIGSLSVLSANGSVPEATMTGSYRGATMERHLRPKARLECIVGDEYAQAVIETVLKDGAERTFAFVLPVEEAHPSTTIKSDAVAV